MALLLSNSTLSTTRDGVSGNVLTCVRSHITPAKMTFTPIGPQRIQRILIDPAQNVAEGDYITATFQSGLVRVGKVNFVDEIEGGLSYMALTVVGGLLPPT